MSRICFFVIFFFFIGAGEISLADSPGTEPPQLAALEVMVNNLGYTTTLSDDKSAFTFTYQGKSSYDMTFNLSNDGANIYGYVALAKILPAEMAHAPLVKMIEFNDGGDAYFSMENHSDHESLYMNTILGTSGLTPQLLRTRLSGFAGYIDDNANLWDPKSWH